MTHECNRCGKTFDDEHGLDIHLGKDHKQPWQDKETMERLYWDEDMTMAEIADKFDTTDGTIHRWINRLGIKSKPTGPNNKVVPTHEFVQARDSINGWYENVRVMEDYENKSVRVHRLIAIAHGMLEPSELTGTDKEVHHKNGHGLDNRPENIEVYTKSEHSRIHMQERMDKKYGDD